MIFNFKIKLLSFVFLLLLQVANAQEKFTVSGTIKDAKNGETLIGSTVTLLGTTASVATNAFGFYSLTIPKGKQKVVYNYLGYKSQTIELDIIKNEVINLELSEKTQELKEVIVTSEKAADNVRKIEMSVAKLDIKQIGKLPALLGEVDVIRTVQLLPGVSTVGEGASGFNVRGGSIDQNLILLDDAPVYNSSHLFGFFSVFNPDAVRDLKLLKGGIPSQYGGRLSSLLDVRMKDGNSKRYQVNGGIGTIFSRLSIEGPIIKDKASFVIAARRSYFDWLFFPFSTQLKGQVFNFYDLTFKTNFKLSDKDKLYASGYAGRDNIKFGGKNGFGFNWGNYTTTVRYNHIYSSKLFSNVSAIYSKYNYQLGAGTDSSGFEWTSHITNYQIKPEFTYYLNSRNTLTFGGQSQYYDFDPGTLSFGAKGNRSEQKGINKYTFENAIYAGNEQEINSWLSFQYGLRLNNFNYVGKGKAYYYPAVTNDVSRDTTSTKTYSNNQIIKTYNNLEPRFSTKFQLNDLSSIKISYNRMVQNIHLISNTSASVPLDVWTPSTNNIKPQLADQLALGYFRNFGKNEMFESSVEVYYKDLQNQIDYVRGANLLLNPKLEGELLTGNGRAYGAEFYLKKTTGKLTGWISYTIARTERQVKFINGYNWYPTRFDKFHNLNIVLTYDITKQLNVSASFAFSTGTPTTFPSNGYTWQGYYIPHNVDEARNNVRIPNYDRLDLSMQYEFKNKNNNRWWKMTEQNIVVSVYNSYGKFNPFSVYVTYSYDKNRNFTLQPTKFGLFVKPIPSITYNFKF
jgi:hypothetical protein